MGFTTKSLRLDTDNPILKNFVDKQTNFSSAIKYLILYYCSTHPKIEDLSIKYKEITSYAVMDQIRKIEGEGMSAPQPEIKHDDASTEQEDAATEAPAEKTASPTPEPKKKTSGKTRSTRKTTKTAAVKKDIDDNDASTISKDYSEYM